MHMVGHTQLHTRVPPRLICGRIRTPWRRKRATSGATKAYSSSLMSVVQGWRVLDIRAVYHHSALSL